MLKRDNKSKVENPDRLNRLVSGTKVTGDLVANSSLRIDGEVIGNVRCNGKFVLGSEGVITGDVFAVEVELDGTIKGTITAESLLTLHKTSVVTGDIRTKRLVIEDGAQVEGNIQTGDVPSISFKDEKQVEKDKTSPKKQEKDMVY